LDTVKYSGRVGDFVSPSRARVPLSPRVDEAAEASGLGLAGAVERLLSGVRVADPRGFAGWLERVALALGDVDMTRWGLRERMLVAALYRRPPRLALVSARLEGGRGEAVALINGGSSWERWGLRFDGASRLFGAAKSVRRGVPVDTEVEGPYIPVSAVFMVLPFEAPVGKKVMVVRGSAEWHVYEARENPLPYNLLAILTYEKEK